MLKETRGGEGITVLLLEKKKRIPGLDTSKCHNPLDVGFPNGTIKADKLRVPISNVIGGVDNCGEGWKMPLECLSEDAQLFTSTAVAASKKTTLEQWRIPVRKQFKTPIYKMEGVMKN